MSKWADTLPLFLILLVCVANGYSMCSYRVPVKQSYRYFTAVTVVCLVINSYIIVKYGRSVFQNVMIFTIGLPYFLMILCITRDTISQTFFNFWLWINIYTVITNVSMFVNDYVLKNRELMILMRLLLFMMYYVLYHKCIKESHRLLMEKLKVNWWVFSFIPITFTVLICLVNYYSEKLYGLTRNYPVLLTIYILMLLVYILMVYSFKTANDSMEKERFAQSMKDQIVLHKKQYEFYMEKLEAQRIFRHDQRFRNSILIKFLEDGDMDGARAFIDKENMEMQKDIMVPFCEYKLIHAVLAEYQAKTKQKGIRFLTSIQMPSTLACDETEFCIMLSNLLENSLEAAKSYINVKIKYLNSQLSLNIKNDYSGELQKNMDGCYVTTKLNGSGLGLKSVNAILKNNHGFLDIDDKNGTFDVYVTLNNETDLD